LTNWLIAKFIKILFIKASSKAFLKINDCMGSCHNCVVEHKQQGRWRYRIVTEANMIDMFYSSRNLRSMHTNRKWLQSNQLQCQKKKKLFIYSVFGSIMIQYESLASWLAHAEFMDVLAMLRRFSFRTMSFRTEVLYCCKSPTTTI